MSVFEPNSRHLREVLIFYFHLKKTAAEAHRMISSAYGEADFGEGTCREWSELKVLLAENSFQTQKELEESLGVTQQAI